MRRNTFINDPLGRHVGQRALQAVTDLDAQFMIVFRDQQQHAVVNALASELPNFFNTYGILLNRFRLCRRNNEDGHLATLALFEILQRLFQGLLLLRVQRSCEIE